jgi:hypothetical protein
MRCGTGCRIVPGTVQIDANFRHRSKLMYTKPIHWILGWSRAVTLLGLAYLAA